MASRLIVRLSAAPNSGYVSPGSLSRSSFPSWRWWSHRWVSRQSRYGFCLAWRGGFCCSRRPGSCSFADRVLTRDQPTMTVRDRAPRAGRPPRLRRPVRSHSMTQNPHRAVSVTTTAGAGRRVLVGRFASASVHLHVFGRYGCGRWSVSASRTFSAWDRACADDRMRPGLPNPFPGHHGGGRSDRTGRPRLVVAESPRSPARDPRRVGPDPPW